MNPFYKKNKDLYNINELAFSSKSDIINSRYIQQILPPYQSFTDKRNKKGFQSYKRYMLQGSFISSANICLDSVLGITNKKQPEISLPKNMQNLIYYATVQGTDILNIQNKLVQSIFKYGLAGLKVVIPGNISIADNTPLLQVIQGKNIVDYGIVKTDKGTEKYSFVTLDSSRYVFNETTKNYSYTKIYKVLGLDAANEYYECEFLQMYYSQFNFKYPESHKFLLNYHKPTWTSTIDFIPFIGINKVDTTIKYQNSFIQDIINLSLQNYRLSCNLGWLQSSSAASHLVIKGKNLDNIQNYPTGAGAIHVLNDDTAQEYYVTPSTAGMSEIKEHIKDNNTLIDAMTYSLINAAANASGQSLKFRIAVKVADLIALIKNIGNAITLSLEYIDKIINNGINKDLIDYKPYLNFADLNEYISNDIQEKQVIQEQPEKEEIIKDQFLQE